MTSTLPNKTTDLERRVAELEAMLERESKRARNQTALYKIASRGGNPALNTLVPLLESLGLGLSIKVLEQSPGDEGIGETQEPSRHAQSEEISLPE